MGVPMNEEAGAVTPRNSRRLRHCCCCCSLQIGSIGIGYLTMMNSLGILYFPIKVFIEEMPRKYHTLDPFFYLILIFGILQFASSIRLIYGADQKRTSLMNFWLCVCYVELAIVICLAIYFLYILTLLPWGAFICVVTIGGIISSIGLIIYSIAIVHSFIREVTEEMQSLNEELNVSRLS